MSRLLLSLTTSRTPPSGATFVWTKNQLQEKACFFLTGHAIARGMCLEGGSEWVFGNASPKVALEGGS